MKNEKLLTLLKFEETVSRVVDSVKPVYDHELEEMLDSSLDDSNDMVKIGRLEYSPSRVLKYADPIAYKEERLSFIDYMTREGELIELRDRLFRSEDVIDVLAEIDKERGVA